MNYTDRKFKTTHLLAMLVLGLALNWLASPSAVHAKTVTVDMTAVETDLVYNLDGDKFHAWTYNGQFPGPVVRVTEGDTVKFTLTNPKTNKAAHSMDFHAAETDFLKNYHPINPGETIAFDFVAKKPGVFAYHCGAAPMLQHIARGMIGVIIVDPKDSSAMPKADREYVLVQTEFWKDAENVQAMFDRHNDNAVFNGVIFKYHPLMKNGTALESKPGERVRIFFVNGGPNNFSALHPIAEIWDDVWPTGNPANRIRGEQTHTVGPADGAIFDLVAEAPGAYPIVTHSLSDALRGAIAVLLVSKDAKTLPLMPYVEAAK